MSVSDFAIADETIEPTSVTVVVRLKDGSELSSIADARTDDRYLVLRFASTGVKLMRRVPWHQVAEVFLNERPLTAKELQTELKTRVLDTGNAPPPPLRSQPSDAAAYTNLLTISASPNVQIPASLVVSDRIQSLNVVAEVINWDRDVAVDGLRILVQPLNANGKIVPVNGVVDVRLFGQASLRPTGIRDFRRVDGFPEIGTWNQRLRKEDFIAHGATYQFEFRRTHPEFNDQLGAIGLTHARLSVVGEGVFEASDAMTPIRPFSVYRDWHQQSTGHRFLPAEHLNIRN